MAASLVIIKMPGGRRNVFSVSQMLNCLHDVSPRAKDRIKDGKSSLTKKLEKYGHDIPFVDLSIQVEIILVHLL